MAWLRDFAWQQGLAILLVVAGAVLIYHGATGAGELGGRARLGIALFTIGMALPLISQVIGARRESAGKSEDV